MLRKLKYDFRSLVKGKPGKRFVEHHDRHRQTRASGEASWKRWVFTLTAVALLLVGLLFSLVPGLPGFLLWIPALSMLATRLKIVAVSLDRIELRLRSLFGRR